MTSQEPEARPQPNLPIYNFTGFFHREMKMYGFQGISFPAPISVPQMLYSLLFIGIYSVPVFLMAGASWVFAGPFNAILTVGPPLLLAHYIAKPLRVFNFKTLPKFAATMFKYALDAPVYYDTVSSDCVEADYPIIMSLWISDDSEDDAPEPKDRHWLFRRRSTSD